jgi:predicted chitinase
MDQWKVRVRDANKDISDIIKGIQDAQPDEKIGTILARSKNIYLGKFTYEDIEYPVTIYGNGTDTKIEDALIKIQVTDADVLEDKDNINHIYCDETPIDYMIIGFYEEGKDDPTLIMQIEKFDISKWQFTKEKWLEYLGILGELEELKITLNQLEEIFPETDTTRLKEVMKAVNNNSSDFNITSVARMSHFLGQIGTETGGMKSLKEGSNYSPRTIAKIFPYPKYGHLFEEAIFDSISHNYTYNPVNFDINNCEGQKISQGSTIFSYANSSKVRNAYAEIKNDTMEVVGVDGIIKKVSIYKTRTDVTKDNIEEKVLDLNYNSGHLKVKSEYIQNDALFDVTYACRMGNGSPSTKDGSTFKGKGFIQLTGKEKYERISEEWNLMYPDDLKEFHGKDISLLETDIEVAMKASMICWKIQGLNSKADEGMTNDVIDNVGRIVNGSGEAKPNGWEHRRSYTTSAYEVLNK